ncbi:hypothetical protein SKAU_G00063270 [Synaphobranchus kaupii]|uniref:Uncharacterized protein n=1 Tax=Synaphobranchus kaupii TaxID=118154 RepID=A0A9Q1G6C6_SYNKA|nr:hypothetical protein SKAU_G00063270 [Synaphobranchus kaupii]
MEPELLLRQTWLRQRGLQLLQTDLGKGVVRRTPICRQRVRAGLRCIADLAGPGLRASEVVASHLGVRSVRFMQTVLDRWREALTEPKWALLTDYLAGNKSDIASDPFPELSIAPDLNGMEYNGPMLDFGDCEGVGRYQCFHCTVKVHGKAGEIRD